MGIDSWYYIQTFRLFILSIIPVFVMVVYPGFLVFRCLRTYSIQWRAVRISCIDTLIISFLLGLVPISIVLRIIVSLPSGYQSYVGMVFKAIMIVLLVDFIRNFNSVKGAIAHCSRIAKLLKRESLLADGRLLLILGVCIYSFFIVVVWFVSPRAQDVAQLSYLQDIVHGQAYPLFSSPGAAFSFRPGWTFSALVLVSGSLSIGAFPLLNTATALVFCTNALLIYSAAWLIKNISIKPYLYPISFIFIVVLLVSSRFFDYLATAKYSVLSIAIFFTGLVFLLRFFQSGFLFYGFLSGYAIGISYDCGLAGILFGGLTLLLLFLFGRERRKIHIVCLIALGTVVIYGFSINIPIHGHFIVFYILLYLAIIGFVLLIMQKTNISKISFWSPPRNCLKYLSAIVFILAIPIMSIPYDATVWYGVRFFWYGKGFVYTFLYGYGLFFFAIPFVIALSFFYKNKALILNILIILIIIAIGLPCIIVIISKSSVSHLVGMWGGGKILSELARYKPPTIYDITSSVHRYYFPFVISLASVFVFNTVLHFTREKAGKTLFIILVGLILYYIIFQPDPFAEPARGGAYRTAFTPMVLRIKQISKKLDALKENVRKTGPPARFSALITDRYPSSHEKLMRYLGDYISSDNETRIVFFIPPKSSPSAWKDRAGLSFFAWQLPWKILGRGKALIESGEYEVLNLIDASKLLVIHKDRLANATPLFCERISENSRVIYENEQYIICKVE